MTVFNSVQAGRYLGVTDRTIRNWINRGELSALSVDPVRLDSRHVHEVLRARQAAALADLAGRMQDPVRLARETRRVLHPKYLGVNLPQDRAEAERRRLSLVSDTARLLFGTASLNAALLEAGCRWCKAQEHTGALEGLWAPAEYSEAFRALFDQEPCERCAPGLYRPLMAALEARVHPGRHRPPDARAEAAAAAAAAVPVAPRPQPAQPRVGDDDGKALISRRRREVQARLKAARRSGDTKYALRLQQQLQSLTADASVVDGRAVSAARPGTLRCGHALAAGCSCPRRASKRATS